MKPQVVGLDKLEVIERNWSGFLPIETYNIGYGKK